MASESLRLDQQLCFALYAATHAITRAYRVLLAEMGLTYPQYLVLLVLLDGRPQTVTGLANELKLGAGTLTPLLKRMAEMGLIRRLRSREDERVVTVTMTAEGEGLRDRLAAVQREVVCQVGMTEEGFLELRDTLHDLVDRLSGAESPGSGLEPPDAPIRMSELQTG